MKAFFRNPWVIGGIGMLALSLLVYFVGPLVSIGESRPLGSATAVWVTIVVLVMIWVIVQLVITLRARKATENISSGIVEAASAEQETSARSAEEVAALKAQFEEAVAALKKSGGTKGKSLYDLPWYMIIGPPGAGKTTALVNSGLKFPLSERFGKGALRGVGGTRNCDWWFTDEAILLDTAGRYTTQDSQAAVDRAAWEGFLGLLKKYRKRRPINGVLVAISALDFMTLDENARREHAMAIKQRIAELDEFFGMRFPVYVLVTKCDLVNGFVDFFDDLGVDEREQVWGVTLPLDDNNQGQDPAFVASELDAVLQRLDERLFSRLHQERDVKRRGQIYSFPRQMSGLKAPLINFLEEVFRGSRFEDSALLRGVYFTSGTQEGTPIDRVMSSIAQTFGLQQQALPSFSGQGRSYFITRLLQHVVFPEAEIAGTNQKVERRRAWIQRIAYAGVFVVVGLLIAGWTLSFFGNRALIAQTATQAQVAQAALAEIPARRPEAEVTLAALNQLDKIGSADSEEDSGLFTGLGLDQHKKFREQGEAAYRRALVNQLLPRVMLRLEQQIEQPGMPQDYTYEALKAYLRLGTDKHYDAESIGAWVTLDWDQRLRRVLGNDGVEEMTEHLSTLLARRPAQLPLPMDQTTIAAARQKLSRVPLEQRVYARLKSANLSSGGEDFTIMRAAGPEAAMVFVRSSGKSITEGIPAFYTRRGYDKVFGAADSVKLISELSSEQWVLRDDVDLTAVGAELEGLIEGLRKLYFEDYAREYEGLVYDLELAPFKSAKDAADILNILSRPGDSPLTLLIAAVKHETSFADNPEEEAEKESAGDAFAAQRQRLQAMLGGKARLPTVTPYGARRFANVVEERFSELHKLSGDDPSRPAPVDHLLNLLRDLANFMMTVASSAGSGGAVPQHLVQSGQANLQRTQFEAERQVVPITRELLASAAGSVSDIAFGGQATSIENKWKSGPLSFCQRAVAARYPVDRSAESEIRVEDFGRFFGYGGEVDKFFQGYLNDLIDTSSRPWRAQSGDGVKISPEAIRQFERANAVMETFFRGDATPLVGFELTPVSMDPSITQFTLTINGQSTKYFHGPRVPQPFTWPGALAGGEVRVEMAPIATESMRSERGPWAWFRMLDAANMRPGGGSEQFLVDFSLGGRTATYQLTARSAYNPFQLPELSQFRCLDRLTQ